MSAMDECFKYGGKQNVDKPNVTVCIPQITRFLRMKFRTMERLQQRVQEEERRMDKQSGGVLIMDLEGLVFSTTLLSVLAGKSCLSFESD